jgi:hypothetical protein
MRTTLLSLGIVALCLGAAALADGNDGHSGVYELTKSRGNARFSIFNVKEGTMLLDTATGHTWRLEFQAKAGYTWSQVPRGIMKDPEYSMPNPVTGE